MGGSLGAGQISLEAVLSYAALGLIVGFGYYISMQLPERAASLPRWMLQAVYALRLAAAIAFFAWLAHLGMLPVLAAFVGFLVGRTVAFRALGEDA
ncbi:MAG: hypothetical protein IPK66_04925 [Rhodospirillales bacterium]|nr:hypothetical protein [Rhodospirillales bacterium]